MIESKKIETGSQIVAIANIVLAAVWCVSACVVASVGGPGKRLSHLPAFWELDSFRASRHDNLGGIFGGSFIAQRYSVSALNSNRHWRGHSATGRTAHIAAFMASRRGSSPINQILFLV